MRYLSIWNETIARIHHKVCNTVDLYDFLLFSIFSFQYFSDVLLIQRKQKKKLKKGKKSIGGS